MDELLIILNKIWTFLKEFSLKAYRKLSFLFNKQLTLQKMYEPLTESRVKANQELALKLASLKKENSNVISAASKLNTENLLLINNISVMQELLLKK